MKNIITEIENRVPTYSSDPIVQLDETYESISHIPALKTTLYPHQKTAIKAMIDIEAKRVIEIKCIRQDVVPPQTSNANNKQYAQYAQYDNFIQSILNTGLPFETLKRCYDQYAIPYKAIEYFSAKYDKLKAAQSSAKYDQYRITYNTAVFTDPVGVGKTITILGLILMSQKPRALPEIIRLSSDRLLYARAQYKKLLKPTLCIVNKSVLAQWEIAITRFTDLRFYIVKSVTELRKLFFMIESGSISDYDIVVIKNGKITVPFEMPSNIKYVFEANKRNSTDIYNILANLYEYCWARVVVDDYDTVGLPQDTCNINALFTWLISSSKYAGVYSSKAKNLEEALLFRSIQESDINNNSYLFKYLNVKNDKNYIETNLAMPKVKYHIVSFKNESNKIISILKSVGDDDLSRISEMLNSNAINSAAKMVGIESNSVQDIFKTVLGNKWSGYETATDLINFITYQSSDEKVEARKSMKDNPDPEDTYGKADLLVKRDIEYKYPGVNTLLTENRDEYVKIKTKLGIEIDRIKSSLSEGECPICTLVLKEFDEIIISKCCFVVMCSDCAIKSNGFHDKFNRLQNGNCPNCRAKTTINNMIFFQTKFIKIDNIIKEIFVEEPVSEEEKKDANVPEVKKEITNKREALLEIIKSGSVPGDVRIDMNIANMMPGYKIHSEPAFRKVLVFSNYDETLHDVEEDLKKSSVKYWHLCGSNYDITRIANEFTNCVDQTCVMIINSTKYCSGLNLQTATDLVFMHFIYDINIETQVGGRGQRIGRKSQLNIWYLMNDNEKVQLMQRYNTRELSKDELLEEQSASQSQDQSAVKNNDDLPPLQNSFVSLAQGATKPKSKSKKIIKKAPVEDDYKSDDDEF